MKIIVNCPQTDCPRDWAKLEGCGESHLAFCAQCFRKVQLAETPETVAALVALEQIAAAEEAVARTCARPRP